MMKRIRCIGFIVLLWCTSVAYGQINVLKQTEDQITEVIGKSYAACVRICPVDSIYHRQIGGYFSGVVVDKNGTILTVAHATKTGQTYRVNFPDGRSAVATALGRIALFDTKDEADAALIRIDQAGDWPAAEIGWSGSLQLNELCVSISYPETLNQTIPTIRFGRISKLSDGKSFLCSSCAMEPGDSGGPLFDLQGRVIGLHSNCGIAEEENNEVPIDIYRKYWHALHKPKDYQKLPADTSIVGIDTLKDKGAAIMQTAGLTSYVRPKEKEDHRVVKLLSVTKGTATSILGTVFNMKGKSYILSKSSLIGDSAAIQLDKNQIWVRVVNRDQANDLVLLQIPTKIKGTLDIAKDIHHEPTKNVRTGSFLISLTDQGTKIGVRSAELFNQPRKYSAGYMGTAITFDSTNVSVIDVAPGSPTASAGVKSGDIIRSVNGKEIKSPEDYMSSITQTEPGDTVSLQIARGNSTLIKEVVTASWPKRNHFADRYEGGRSLRSDGFPAVIPQDAVIKVWECGSPVFDEDGNFFGINIARFSRTATFVIPQKIIYEFIMDSLKS